MLKATEDLLQEVERQLSMGVNNVSEDDRWMLELDMDQVLSFFLADKQLWIHAVEAARQASTRAMELSEGATNNWNDIIKDKKYADVPSKTQTHQDSSAPVTTEPRLQKTDKETSSKKKRESACPDATLARSTTYVKTGLKSKPSRQRKRSTKKTDSKASDRVHMRSRPGFGSLVCARNHRSTNVSQEAMDADNSGLGLFSKKDTLEPRGKRLLKTVLTKGSTYVAETSPDGSQVLKEVDTFKIDNLTATQSDFRRLKGSEWLTDNIIGMFLRVSVQEVVDSTFCYTSHFFSSALSESDNNVMYDHSRVESWSDKIDGGLFNLDQLFIPIHVDNKTHWVFIRVQFGSKSIELYDSHGSANPQHRQYLWAMRRYLYEEKISNVALDDRPDFDEWKGASTTQNKSRDLPKQANTFDCGMFVIILIYLLSRGVQLQHSSYTQYGVTSRELQRSIAYVNWQANELLPSVSVA